jgi:hypothetical protein
MLLASASCLPQFLCGWTFHDRWRSYDVPGAVGEGPDPRHVDIVAGVEYHAGASTWCGFACHSCLVSHRRIYTSFAKPLPSSFSLVLF